MHSLACTHALVHTHTSTHTVSFSLFPPIHPTPCSSSIFFNFTFFNVLLLLQIYTLNLAQSDALTHRSIGGDYREGPLGTEAPTHRLPAGPPEFSSTERAHHNHSLPLPPSPQHKTHTHSLHLSLKHIITLSRSLSNTQSLSFSQIQNTQSLSPTASIFHTQNTQSLSLSLKCKTHNYSPPQPIHKTLPYTKHSHFCLHLSHNTHRNTPTLSSCISRAFNICTYIPALFSFFTKTKIHSVCLSTPLST